MKVLQGGGFKSIKVVYKVLQSWYTRRTEVKRSHVVKFTVDFQLSVQLVGPHVPRTYVSSLGPNTVGWSSSRGDFRTRLGSRLQTLVVLLKREVEKF